MTAARGTEPGASSEEEGCPVPEQFARELLYGTDGLELHGGCTLAPLKGGGGDSIGFLPVSPHSMSSSAACSTAMPSIPLAGFASA